MERHLSFASKINFLAFRPVIRRARNILKLKFLFRVLTTLNKGFEPFRLKAAQKLS